MPPLPKTCPKMVLSHKGVAFCVKDVLQKNIFWCRERFLAARAHRFFGNTLVKAGHLMRPSVVSGTVRVSPPRGTGTCRSPRFRTDRAGLGESKACSGKPMFAPTLKGQRIFRPVANP